MHTRLRIQTQTGLIPRPLDLNPLHHNGCSESSNSLCISVKAGRFTGNMKGFEGGTRICWKRHGDWTLKWRKISWVTKMSLFANYYLWASFLPCQPDLASLQWGRHAAEKSTTEDILKVKKWSPPLQERPIVVALGLGFFYSILGFAC